MQRFFFKLNSSIGESWDFHRTSIYQFLIFYFNTYKEKISSKSFQVASFLINNFEDPFIVLRYGSYFMYAHKEVFYWFIKFYLTFSVVPFMQICNFFQSKLWEEY